MSPKTLEFFIAGREDRLAVEITPDGTVRVQGVDRSMAVTPVDPSTYIVDAAGGRQLVSIAEEADRWWVFVDGEVLIVERRQAAPASRISLGPDCYLEAPMPATVTKILAEPGQTVRRDDVVVILEAMKMELPLRAPHDASVHRINCRPGDLVQPGQVLVELR
jgi:biotin carboxyl carrier protein